MSYRNSSPTLPLRFSLVLRSFLQHAGLPFSDALSEDEIQKVFDTQDVGFAMQEDEVYCPAVTLWAFLSQVLFKDEQRSCAAAVARVVVMFVALGKDSPSSNTGAYCRARAKLPESVLQELVEDVARRCEQQVPTAWLWKGRHVHLVDGTTFSMPDTEANQAEFPQPNTQQAGLGFPIARLVVLVSLATALTTGYAMGPYSGKESGETALLRQLFEQFSVGDILLGDRYYCGWFTLVLLLQRGVDVVTRQHQLRTTDFRRGRRLGKSDHLVVWPKPARPDWMDKETYDSLPDSLTVRELEVCVEQPGFRVDSFVVVTTLTQATRYSNADIAKLYHKRWLAELDIRAIKISLGMDVLRCKSPEMIRREVAACLLAYNLIRQTMLQSAYQAGVSPRHQSFTAALQKIAAGFVVLAVLETCATTVGDTHREQLPSHRVGHRPDRIEPRCLKRRPKSQKLLTIPRDQARADLLATRSP
ncbi:MAG: IS4 family transposase [Planctomycetaceae bacterium]|nr:IS4 family transposase [Planctomycetales bacterium]MCB9873200.1 IS4 family transposase [Planctomycetaceae bacterium]MCB9940718.1 IS4 family transposase [Planctomycetaceae bacterium]MCB9941108.1 IS4 family transposase [Planctomycetaceae bacterium]MCB9941781.1 IS4 family transposase [Planctomycetaceae bacterium]